jgi:ethanolamine-phosphate cytidylyltransferase
LCHFGHFNFLRKASAITDELIVGVHPDEEILQNKGPPVFSLSERLELVTACKWVKQVVTKAPYTPRLETLDENGCEVCIHGDDVSLNADGIDCYHVMRAHNRFVTVPRTKAISTTNLIGRMLRLPESELPPSVNASQFIGFAGTSASLHTYIPSTHRIAQFSSGREAQRGERVVYADGTFDLLHPGHVSFLRKAKALGDYLVVGVHDDRPMGQLRCPATPIMTLHERVLNVLAMKYVDDVIIGAPPVITKELIDQIEPSIVVEGSSPSRRNGEEAFRLPKQLGIFQQIQSDYPEFTARQVICRVLENYSLFAERNLKRETLPTEVQGE